MVLAALLSGCSTPWFEITFKGGEEKVEEDKPSEEIENECEIDDCEEVEVDVEEVEVDESLSYEKTLNEFLNDIEVDDRNGKIAYVKEVSSNYETFQNLAIVDSNIGVVMEGKYEGFLLRNASYDGLGSERKSNLYLYNPVNSERLFIDGYVDDDIIYGSVVEDVEGKLIDDYKIPELNTSSRIYLEDFDVNVEGGTLLYNEFLYEGTLNGLDTISTPFGDLYVNGSIFYKPIKDNFYTKYFYDAGEYWLGPNDLVGLSGNDVSLESDYSVFSGGCGWFGNGYFTVKTSDLDLGNLELVGENGSLKYYKPINGEGIYSAEEAYERRLVSEVWSTFQFRNPESLLSFEEFFEMTPVLFWKDPMGNYSTLVRSDMVPAAECGKPVVYLYPEKPMDVSVAVDIEEFTVTIPYHGDNGWDVLAYPDGQIYNYKDEQTYDYLFWEGFTDEAVSTEAGFAVEKAELNKFFDEKLATMGLNEQEIYDFKDFWIPVMEEDLNDWFFVTFVGTEAFNKVAPLDITPEPDTLARIFMYYEGRPSEFRVEPQRLKGFEREGFTVVEWGGTTNKDWK